MIRATIADIIGDYAMLEFDGLSKIVPRSKLPKQAVMGDVVVYRNRKLVLDSCYQLFAI